MQFTWKRDCSKTIRIYLVLLWSQDRRIEWNCLWKKIFSHVLKSQRETYWRKWFPCARMTKGLFGTFISQPPPNLLKVITRDDKQNMASGFLLLWFVVIWYVIYERRNWNICGEWNRKKELNLCGSWVEPHWVKVQFWSYEGKRIFFKGWIT